MPEDFAVGHSDRGLVHNFELLMHWTRDEHAYLEQLVKYSSNGGKLCYGKIAQQLQGKSIRDVAFIFQWMAKNKNGKRRKVDNGSSRKQKVKRVKSSSHATNCANCLPYAQSPASMDTDDVISYKDIGGISGMLLEQNAKSFDQISANFSALNVHDNFYHFCQTRDNIIALLNKLHSMPTGIMQQMPPLPMKLNMELSNSILPPSDLKSFVTV